MKFNLKNLRIEINSLHNAIKTFELSTIQNQDREASDDANRIFDKTLSVSERLPHTLFLMISAYYRAFNTISNNDKDSDDGIIKNIHISRAYFIKACNTTYVKDTIHCVKHTTAQARRYNKMLPQYKYDFITNIKHCISYLPEIVHA